MYTSQAILIEEPKAEGEKIKRRGGFGQRRGVLQQGGCGGGVWGGVGGGGGVSKNGRREGK